MRIDRRTFSRVLAMAGLACAGCKPDNEPSSATAPPPRPEPGGTEDPSPESLDEAGEAPPHPGALRFLALGDSYTIGESVPPAERWPVQLARALRAQGIDVGDPEIIARTGWRTDDLDAAITAANPRGPYHLVSLLIGVNNQYQGRTSTEYREQFSALLQRAISLAGGEASRVIVLSIPDWGATPYGQHNGPEAIAKQIDEFNAINRGESQRAGVRYVDVTPISRRGIREPELVARDGLHPSGKMYAQWVKLAIPAAREALSASAVAPGEPGG